MAAFYGRRPAFRAATDTVFGAMNIRLASSKARTVPAGSVPIAVQAMRKSFGAVTVLDGVDLHVEPGSIVALLGPSGCGKTTLLRLIAGLEQPDAGEVHIGGQVVSGAGKFVAPERRRVGMVFQDWALFPHLSVTRNVGYGLARGERHGPKVDAALAMVGLAGFGDRMPHTLSGGQKQRVALARALAPAPAALLLDEPFSNLDTSLRAQVRTEVHRLLNQLGITTVFVTHDQAEAFVLGDQVAVMHEGRIEQQARPSELYAVPASRWVARFIGEANLVRGFAEGDRATTPCGMVPLAARCHGEVEVLVRPEALRLGAAGSGGTEATVDLVEYYGHDTVYEIEVTGGTRVRVRTSAAPDLARGDRTTVRYVGGPTVAYEGFEEDAPDAPPSATWP
jgi:iron(III) transport system ATP-binding protein